jgi:hypothetical protein
MVSAPDAFEDEENLALAVQYITKFPAYLRASSKTETLETNSHRYIREYFCGTALLRLRGGQSRGTDFGNVLYVPASYHVVYIYTCGDSSFSVKQSAPYQVLRPAPSPVLPKRQQCL